MGFRSGLFALPMVLGFLACRGTSSPEEVELALQASFEGRDLGPGGFSTATARPARYCFAEVRDAGSEAIWASGYLGGEGTAWATVPNGVRVYLKVYAQFEIPAAVANQDFFFRGSVKLGRGASGYATLDAFNALPNATFSSAATTASGALSLAATAPESTRESGPFAIADQAVAFGLGIQRLEPSLKLPNLHCFWNPSLGAPTPATTYPTLAVDTQGYALRQPSGRAVFQSEVRAHASGATAQGADEFNDGKLLEAFSHLLFADYSYPADGKSFGSIIRRDNDPVYVAREAQAEASLAFTDGFCDFLSGALRNTPSIHDLQPNGTLQTYRLDRHDQFPRAAGQGEFYRGAVANSLWGLWKNALGGGTSGLQTLWEATLAKQPGEFLFSPLGAYHSYLTGLKRSIGMTSPAWPIVLQELAKEDITDITQGEYLRSGALWTTVYTTPFTGTGVIQTYEPALGRYYDRNQAVAFSFGQRPAWPITITLTPTGGQDLWLELLGPGGYVLDAQGLPLMSTADTRVNGVPQPRTLSLGSLPAGEYLVRVRAGYTTATTSASFSLSLQ